MDDREMQMSIPLDEDGFVRRECPTCERELKWLVGPEEEAAPAPVGGYYCPYCGIQAPPNAWFTKAQLQVAEAIVSNEIVGPALEGFAKDLKKLETSGGFLQIKVETDTPDEVDVPTLTEPNDMRRVDFPCHPGESIKVLEDWDGPVRCVICGSANAL